MLDLLDPTTLGLVLAIVVVAIAVARYLSKGLFLIRENPFGVLNRKMGGRRMPPGQAVARQGEVEVQVTTSSRGSTGGSRCTGR